MREIEYDRVKATKYAHKWALKRNSAYYDFENIGGDCTNFVSQCIYEGSRIMNFTPVMGWYYRSVSDRTPSWSGVEQLYNFLVNNKSVGPYAHIVSEKELKLGDIVQLGTFDGHFYHSLFITSTVPQILVTAHTFDAYNKSLLSYSYDVARFIHIDGVRIW